MAASRGALRFPLRSYIEIIKHTSWHFFPSKYFDKQCCFHIQKSKAFKKKPKSQKSLGWKRGLVFPCSIPPRCQAEASWQLRGCLCRKPPITEIIADATQPSVFPSGVLRCLRSTVTFALRVLVFFLISGYGYSFKYLWLGRLFTHMLNIISSSLITKTFNLLNH